MDWLSRIKEFLSLNTRHIFVIAFVAWVIILMPRNITEYFDVHHLISTYRSWIAAIAFVATFIVVGGIIFDLIIWAFQHSKTKWYSHKQRSETIKNLHSLIPEEKEFLRDYIGKNKHAIVAYAEHFAANSLIEKGILKTPRGIEKDNSFNYHFEIQSWAFEYLSKHPSLLDE